MTDWRGPAEEIRAALSGSEIVIPETTEDELWAMGYETDEQSARRAQAEVTAREEILLARLTRVE